MGSMQLAGIVSDMRYAMRLVRRERVYTATAIIAIALGVAATTSLFSVAYGVLLKPLPWPDADRLVRFEERRGGQPGRVPWTITNGTYLAWQENASTIEALGGWSPVPATLRGVGDPDRIRIARMTPSMFAVLKARPAMGRLFVAADAATSQPTTVILAHGFWQRRFGAAADVIGRSIQLDERTYTVVGVMPAEFLFPDRETQAWVPAHIAPVMSEGGKRISLMIFSAMARMRPATTPEQVAAEGAARARGGPDLGATAVAMFGNSGPATVGVARALDVATAEVRPAIRMLLVAVLFLLGTAVASVATLQLARAAKGRREMTVRAALGAGPGRLVRQWLIESALFGVAGGLLGALSALLILRTLPHVLPQDFPRLTDVAFDWRVALFSAGVTLVASVVTGLVPGLQARRVDLVQPLSEESVATMEGSKRTPGARARAALMIAQIAVACVLLVGAGLLVRSLVAMMHVDRGYDPKQLLTARLPLPPRSTFAQSAAMLERLRDRLRQVPGVSEAAFGNALPMMSAGMVAGHKIPSPRDPATQIHIQSLHRTVSPDYLSAMRLRLVAGRFLSDADTATSQPVLVVNRSFATQYLGNEPIGTRLRLPMWDRSDWEVVGIVDDMKQGGLNAAAFTPSSDEPQPEIFSSYRQVGGMMPANVFLVVRTAADPSALVDSVRALVREQAPSLVMDSVMTMEDRVMSSLAKPRTYAFILAMFAFFALTIAAVGLFGVLSYSVAQRTREIGVRTALGARTSDIVKLVLAQGAFITVVGLAVGLAVSTIVVRSMSTILFGVQPHDTVTFVAVPLALAAVAALACAGPAVRAAKIDPLRALRSG